MEKGVASTYMGAFDPTAFPDPIFRLPLFNRAVRIRVNPFTPFFFCPDTVSRVTPGLFSLSPFSSCRRNLDCPNATGSS